MRVVDLFNRFFIGERYDNSIFYWWPLGFIEKGSG